MPKHIHAFSHKNPATHIAELRQHAPYRTKKREALTIQLMPVEMLRSRIAPPAIIVRTHKLLLASLPRSSPLLGSAGSRSMAGVIIVPISILRSSVAPSTTHGILVAERGRGHLFFHVHPCRIRRFLRLTKVSRRC